MGAAPIALYAVDRKWLYLETMTLALRYLPEGTIATLLILLPILSSVPCACFLSVTPISSAAAVTRDTLRASVGSKQPAIPAHALCQQPFDTMLDKFYQRKVLNLRVFCRKKREGCVWEGELRYLETHFQRDREYVKVECRYRCGGLYQRRLLHNHEMDECPQRSPEVITQSLIRKMAERVDKLDRAHQEDQTKLTAVQTKLTAVQTKLTVVQTKLAAVEKAREEDWEKLSRQIQQLQIENASLRDEKKNGLQQG